MENKEIKVLGNCLCGEIGCKKCPMQNCDCDNRHKIGYTLFKMFYSIEKTLTKEQALKIVKALNQKYMSKEDALDCIIKFVQKVFDANDSEDEKVITALNVLNEAIKE